MTPGAARLTLPDPRVQGAGVTLRSGCQSDASNVVVLRTDPSGHPAPSDG